MTLCHQLIEEALLNSFFYCRKDVRLPVQLQRAMAAEAEAAREARAKVIAAEGEQKASRALREASEVIGDSPAALQLRYLQVLDRQKTFFSCKGNEDSLFPLKKNIVNFRLKHISVSLKISFHATLARYHDHKNHLVVIDKIFLMRIRLKIICIGCATKKYAEPRMGISCLTTKNFNETVCNCLLRLLASK